MNNSIKKVLLIGSGPSTIGQGSEYDYFGNQACIALKEEEIQVVLVNPNPVTSMTDMGVADSVYIEPLNVDIIKRIIETEKPDSILPTMGGDIGLKIALELHQSGFLDDNKLKMLSVTPDMISAVENKQSFKKLLEDVNEPSVMSTVVSSVDAAVSFANEAGFPVIVRPAYTSSFPNADFCYCVEELEQRAAQALESSMLHQILVEKCISGWKELEYEVVRDCVGNCICVSNLENIDPVGIHTGDSIIVAPSQTLSDSESAKLRAAAINIISYLGVVGSCNVRFALKPDGSEYAVLGVYTRVTRSSSLISKVTGYPIARVSAKLALGLKLFEIVNDITLCTTACNEPAIDYCAVKFPTWSFGNFGEANRTLGASMQSTGCALAIGTSFEMAFMKAIRSINIGVDTPSLPKFSLKSNEEIIEIIKNSDNERIFAVYEALKRGMSHEFIYDMTGIDYWYLAKLKNIAFMEETIKSALDDEIYTLAKNLGFLDETIKRISGRDLPVTLAPNYKMVDTCAAEFDAQKAYFYSAWDDDNEAKIFADITNRGKKKVLVLCSGPNTVGFGDELEYCNAYCIKSLKKLGYSTVVLNNNPDVTSTDFYTSDRLYIDPLTVEDSKHIIETERPWAVIAQFSGINTLQLSESLNKYPVKVLGADSRVIKTLEDFDKLWEILSNLKIPHTVERKLNGTVFEADVIYDGEYCFIPAVVELIEHANVNSGDSITVYPAINMSKKINELIFKYSSLIAKHFNVRGIINLQFMLYNNSLYVTEVRYDTVHNIPFVSKATGLPVVEIALRCMLGEKLSDMGCCDGIYEGSKLCAVRVPVFSFDKLSGADTQLGSQMKSTGEVLGLGSSFEDALLKGLTASGMRIKRSGTILVSLRNSDKQESIPVIEKFSNLGFNIFATAGTAKVLNSNFVAASSVRKIHEGGPSTIDLINSNKVVYVISTSEKGDTELNDDIKIRRRALERQIPTFTTLETANALTRCLANKRSLDDIDIIDIAKNLPKT